MQLIEADPIRAILSFTPCVTRREPDTHQALLALKPHRRCSCILRFSRISRPHRWYEQGPRRHSHGAYPRKQLPRAITCILALFCVAETTYRSCFSPMAVAHNRALHRHRIRSSDGRDENAQRRTYVQLECTCH